MIPKRLFTLVLFLLYGTGALAQSSSSASLPWGKSMPAGAYAVTNSAPCAAGFVKVCETDLTPPRCICEVVVPDPIPGTITPLFYINFVAYAPPGGLSSVMYTQGNSFGSTTSVTKSMKQGIKVTETTKIGVPIVASISLTVSQGTDWGNTKSDAVDIVSSAAAGINIPNQSNGDGTNHDYDSIWFLVGPTLDTQIVPTYPTSPSIQFSWNFRNGSNPIQYYLLVGWLNGHIPMPVDVKNYLDSHGITSAYYAKLLSADPFQNGIAPGQVLDPIRYALIGQLPYLPLPAGATKPIFQTGAISRSTSNTSTTTQDTTYSTGVTVSGSASFLSLFTQSVDVANTWSFTTSTSVKTSAGTTSQDQCSIAQPSSTYVGPTVCRVYFDRIWKTYVFMLDWS